MLPQSFGNQKGVVMRRRRKGEQKLLAQTNPSRGNLSFAAIICDDSSLQPRLPQVVVGNEHVLRVQDLKKVQPSLPRNVYLIRRKSSWLDHVLFAQVITWLRAAVNEIDPNIQILLLCDGSPVHLHPLVFKTAKKHRVRLCVVPASCTWLVQPCDTHLFRKFKAQLAKLFRNFRVQHGMTFVPMTELIYMIVALIRQVLQGTRWVDSFHHNGWGQQQQWVSNRVLVNLDKDVCLSSTAEFPSDNQIKNILPRNRTVMAVWLKFFASDPLEYTPLAEKSTVHGADMTRKLECSVQDSALGSQTSWSGRLRRLPSRIGASVESAAASPPPRQSEPPIPAAQSSRPCPSSMMQPLRMCHPREAAGGAHRRTEMPKARAMARARPRM